ncbi:MAG: L-dopachrome tautomerase-related protein [Gemmatimonadota bacterium]
MSRATLRSVATFEHQVTGVTVSEDGRIFVNFPRWTEDAPVSVAELTGDGGLRPYPDEEWNAWRNAKKNEISPEDHWVCVQSVVADGRGSLWVLDPAAPAQERVVPGGPKLVQVDLASDRVVRTVAFDESVAPQGSYLNDVRFSPDGRYAYITESGAQGALVVVELESGSSRRVLDGHPSTQVEEDVVVKVDGEPLRRTDGRSVEFSADGIALSRDGRYLYWQALTGRTLYRIETEALHDEGLSGDELGGKVERVGENGVSDGLWIGESGRMYISALEENAVKVREGDRVTTLLSDERLRWPDTFSEGPDGTIYVTASHIQDMYWFDKEEPLSVRTELFQIVPNE